MAWKADSLSIFLTSIHSVCISFTTCLGKEGHSIDSNLTIEVEPFYRILNFKKTYSNINFIIYLQEFFIWRYRKPVFRGFGGQLLVLFFFFVFGNKFLIIYRKFFSFVLLLNGKIKVYFMILFTPWCFMMAGLELDILSFSGWIL